MFTCDLYAEVVPQMSPPPHDLERLRTTMVDFIGTQRRVVDFVRVGYFIALNGPLNGHPPSLNYRCTWIPRDVSKKIVFKVNKKRLW